jgi:hypothetical protein
VDDDDRRVRRDRQRDAPATSRGGGSDAGLIAARADGPPTTVVPRRTGRRGRSTAIARRLAGGSHGMDRAVVLPAGGTAAPPRVVPTPQRGDASGRIASGDPPAYRHPASTMK